MSNLMDGKSLVKNLCSWNLDFPLRNSVGDGFILAGSTKEFFNSEIYAQHTSNNVLFCGLDGEGSHARVYIENEEMRKHLGYDSEDGKTKQKILTDEKCEEILGYKTKKAFENAVTDAVVTEPEKLKIIAYAKKKKLNDYDKIAFIEDHTGKKFRD